MGAQWVMRPHFIPLVAGVLTTGWIFKVYTWNSVSAEITKNRDKANADAHAVSLDRLLL
jgi:hypothetical protein